MRREAEYEAFAEATDWGPPEKETFELYVELYVVLLRRRGRPSTSQTNTRAKSTASAIRIISSSPFKRSRSQAESTDKAICFPTNVPSRFRCEVTGGPTSSALSESSPRQLRRSLEFTLQRVFYQARSVTVGEFQQSHSVWQSPKMAANLLFPFSFLVWGYFGRYLGVRSMNLP